MSSYIDQFIYDPNRDTQRTFEEVQAEMKSNKAYSTKEEEVLDVDLENEETKSDDKKVDEALEKAEKKTDEAVSQLSKYADAYKKIASSSSAQKPITGQNLMGTPSSMGAFGPMSAVQQSTSPYFASQGVLSTAKMKELDSKIATLRKILQGGVNV
jgi:hypothetical protein